jgi:ABC-type Fe3+ transport system substrate-binding protein
VKQEYSRGFSEWMRVRHGRRVSIRWLDVGGTSKILKDLESRFASSPDAPGADLMFGGGVGPFLRAAEQGWLARVDIPPEQLKGIPPQVAGTPVYDADHRWFGVALSGFGILYNRPLLRRLGLPDPVSWEDLARPEFLSWVASGDPRSSGSVHMCYEIILQAYGLERGWNLIARLCGNVRRFGESGGSAPLEVASGDVAAAMAIDQYAQTVIDAVGGGALALALPRGATVINADPVAALRGADAPDLAARFIEYALSEDGQRLLFQPEGVNGQRYALYRMPVREALYADPAAPKVRPYEQRATFVYDTARESRRWRIVNDLIGAWLIDSHAELVRAWRAVIAAGADEGLVRTLCATPETDARLEEMADRWSDARYRLAEMNRWAREARARYRDVADTARAGERGG